MSWELPKGSPITRPTEWKSKLNEQKDNDTAGKLDHLLWAVEANKLVWTRGSSEKLPFKVDDKGNVIGKRTGTKYATIDVSSFRELKDRGDSTLYTDKNAVYVRFTTMDASNNQYFGFMKLEDSNGGVSFPAGDKYSNIVTSNGNIYTVDSSHATYNKVNLYGNKWVPWRSKILAVSWWSWAFDSGSYSIDLISFDGKSIIDMSTWKTLPFAVSDASFKVFSSTSLESMSYHEEPIIVVTKWWKKAVYEVSTKQYISLDDWIKWTWDYTEEQIVKRRRFIINKNDKILDDE